jgi:hypothetical protein
LASHETAHDVSTTPPSFLASGGNNEAQQILDDGVKSGYTMGDDSPGGGLLKVSASPAKPDVNEIATAPPDSPSLETAGESDFNPSGDYVYIYDERKKQRSKWVETPIYLGDKDWKDREDEQDCEATIFGQSSNLWADNDIEMFKIGKHLDMLRGKMTVKFLKLGYWGEWGDWGTKTKKVHKLVDFEETYICARKRTSGHIIRNSETETYGTMKVFAPSEEPPKDCKKGMTLGEVQFSTSINGWESVKACFTHPTSHRAKSWSIL